MRPIDQEKAIEFILRKIHSKSGGDLTFAKWLEQNKLFEVNVKDDEEKVPAFHGSVVLLRPSEIEKLERYYTKEELTACYEKLNAYILNNNRGKRYKEHKAALDAWVIEQVVGFKRRTPINQEVKHWNEDV